MKAQSLESHHELAFDMIGRAMHQYYTKEETEKMKKHETMDELSLKEKINHIKRWIQKYTETL